MKPILTYIAIALLINACTSTSTKSDEFGEQKTMRPYHNTSSSKQMGTRSECGNYKTQVDNAKRTQNLTQLGRLLPILERLSCSEAYLDGIRRDMSEMAATKAKVLVQQGQLKEAKKLLNKSAPINLWITQAVRGDIAAKNKQWKMAAAFYNQTLDLIADPKLTPQNPSPTEIKRVYQLAAETQLLVGTITTLLRSGKPSGIMRGNIRGIVIKKRPFPIQFEYNKTTPTDNGKKSARELTKYLEDTKLHSLTLIGHTDHIGSDTFNCELSKGRAFALRDYLVIAGISVPITTIGKGKREPFDLSDPASYTPDEINQINRRVEFVIDSNVSYDNVCF